MGIKNKIKEYQNFRGLQKSLRDYGLSPTEFDVLISTYRYGEWIDYQILREFSKKSNPIFSEQGIMPLSRKGYIKTRRGKDSRKKIVKITSDGKGLVEKVLGF